MYNAVNVLDMLLVSQHAEGADSAGHIQQDINVDGTANFLGAWVTTVFKILVSAHGDARKRNKSQG